MINKNKKRWRIKNKSFHYLLTSGIEICRVKLKFEMIDVKIVALAYKHK